MRSISRLINENPWFRPSKPTMEKWMFTRKGPVKGAAFEAPGLFETVRFTTDTLLFVLAVILEIVGLVAFFIFFGSIIFAVLFFVLDFLFAVGSHWNQGRLRILKNQLALIREFKFGEHKDVDKNGDFKPIAARIRWRKREIFRYKVISVIFYVLIGGIAGFKVLGFMNGWAEQGESFGVIPLLIIITYALVGFIHIYATGYFFAELYARFLAMREKNKHMNFRMFSVDITNPYQHRDIHIANHHEFTHPAVNEIPGVPSPANPRPHIQVNNHWLKYNTLFTFGVLTDEHITRILDSIQDAHAYHLNDKKDLLLKNALFHQLNNILTGDSVQNHDNPPLPPPAPPTPVFPLPADSNVIANDNENYPWFMPSHATMKKWLATRKRPYGAGTFTAPGLFGTTMFGTDAFLFAVAVILEIVGLGFFYAFIGNILFAILFFVIDFVLAIFSHWNKSRWTQLKTQLALISPMCSPDFLFSEPKDVNTDGSKRPCEYRKSWRKSTIFHFKIYSAFFYILICGLAAFKVVGFVNGWAESGEEFGTIPMLVIFTYALVAFIHIYATGYFFSEVIFRYLYRKEKKKHKLTHNYTIPGYIHHQEDVLNIPLMSEVTQGNHRIIDKKLYTFGILTDEQIQNMIHAVSVNDIRIEDFIRRCVHHQVLNIYVNLEPKKPESPIQVLNTLPLIVPVVSVPNTSVPGTPTPGSKETGNDDPINPGRIPTEIGKN